MTYDLTTYTADVEAARNAYAADRAVTAGLCAVCQVRRKEGRARRCLTCRREGVREVRG